LETIAVATDSVVMEAGIAAFLFGEEGEGGVGGGGEPGAGSDDALMELTDDEAEAEAEAAAGGGGVPAEDRCAPLPFDATRLGLSALPEGGRVRRWQKEMAPAPPPPLSVSASSLVMAGRSVYGGMKSVQNWDVSNNRFPTMLKRERKGQGRVGGGGSSAAAGLVTYWGLGRRWFSFCKNEDFLFGAEGQTASAGLLATCEWGRARAALMRGEAARGVFVILAAKMRKRKSRGPTGFGGGGFFGSREATELTRGSNVYAIVESPADLYWLYHHVPPPDRTFEEVVLTCAPHKCHLDVERRYSERPPGRDMTGEEFQEWMQAGLHELFLPRFCAALSRHMGVPVRPEDCRITDSSKPDDKFSSHVVVHTPHCDYFEDRVDGWVVMVLVMRDLEEEAARCARFQAWYTFMVDNKEKRTMDCMVYKRGSQNMRMLGAAKAEATGDHFSDCRVFQPVGAGAARPFEEFVISLFSVPPSQRRRVRVGPEHVEAACAFADAMLARYNRRVPSGHWFSNSFKLRDNLRRHLPDGDPRRPSVPAAQRRWERELAAEADASLGARVKELRDSPDPGERAVYERFAAAAQDRLRRAALAVHGVASVVEAPGRADDVLVVRVPARAPVRWLPRLCFNGCTGGNHMALISARGDLSVWYRCFAPGCPARCLVPSPLRGGEQTAPLVVAGACVPRDFLHGLRDYTREPVPCAQRAGHLKRMRRIHRLPSGLLLPEVGAMRTIVLRGSMGSGKTVRTREFLDTVREEHPGCYCMSITFRRMLANFFAKELGMTNYREVPNLFDEHYFAVQLESLPKLYESRGNPERTVRCYDVVVIDEIESVLAHFDSDTLRNTLQEVWMLFYQVVRFCRCLLVCDADVGPRTFQFLRMTRAVPAGEEDEYFDGPHPPRGPLPGLEFHLNTNVFIRTRFFDYIGEAHWYSRLRGALLAGRSVFFFGNSKARMLAVCELLQRDLLEARSALIDRLRAAPGDEAARAGVANINHVLCHTTVLHGDITEKEKKDMADCDRHWQDCRLLVITPVVGAGVSYDLKTFDVAFGMATPFSCPARAFNQIRGRVRHVRGAECHLLIQAFRGADEEEERGEDDGEEPVTGAPGEAERAVRRANAEDPFSAPRDDISLWSAMQYFRRRGFNEYTCALQRQFRENEGSYVCTIMRRPTINSNLVVIMAYNRLEMLQSRADFRLELLRTLQGTDPHVRYSIVGDLDMEAERRHYDRLREAGRAVRARANEQVASAPLVTRDQYEAMLTADRQGQPMPHMRPDAAASELAVAAPHPRRSMDVLRKFEMHAFYGLDGGVPLGLEEEIVRYAGDPSVRAAVERVVAVLATPTTRIPEPAAAQTDAEVRFLDPDQKVRGSVSLEGPTVSFVSVSPKELRAWTFTLLYIAGYEIPHPVDFLATEHTNPLIILPGVGCGEGHRAVAESRLSDEHMLTWLQNNAEGIATACNVNFRTKGTAANHPPPGEAWAVKHVRNFVKDFFANTFNLRLRGKSRSDRKGAKRNRVGSMMAPPPEEQLQRLLVQRDPDAQTLTDRITGRCAAGHPACGDTQRPVVLDLVVMLSLAHMHANRPDAGEELAPAAAVLDEALQAANYRPAFDRYRVGEAASTASTEAGAGAEAEAEPGAEEGPADDDVEMEMVENMKQVVSAEQARRSSNYNPFSTPRGRAKREAYRDAVLGAFTGVDVSKMTTAEVAATLVSPAYVARGDVDMRAFEARARDTMIQNARDRGVAI
jgi:hypothetical protein